jgi:hypothetical protein
MHRILNVSGRLALGAILVKGAEIGQWADLDGSHSRWRLEGYPYRQR